MPVYNAQRYLDQAITSVLEQTFQDFEFIMVNDGSTDRSLAIMQSYAHRHPCIRIFSRANTGIVGALNDGIAISRAQLIARMDADDVSLPQRLQKQMDYLDAHPDCIMVGSRVLLIDSEGDPICDWALETTHDEIDRSHLLQKWPMVHPTVVIRREALERIGGYRPKYDTQEDLDLFLRMAEIGTICNLPEILLHYRQHFNSTCSTKSLQQQSIRAALFEEAYERRGIVPPEAPTNGFCHHPFTDPDRKNRWWGWMALDAGHVSTARKHALRALRQQPFDIESWRLIYCAARGR